jgi:dynein heavy chain
VSPQVVFLFSDTQIKDESFVEDLSNMLNTYEVPNLIGSGDLAGIFENIRPCAKQAGMDGSRDQLYNFFVQEVSNKWSCIVAHGPLECMLDTPAPAMLCVPINSQAYPSWYALCCD